MLADELDYVLGVDTHRDEHVLAVVTAPAGAVIAGPRPPRPVVAVIGSCFALRGQHAPGRRVWAIEGSGSYGAGLARFLAGRGETVLEVSRTRRDRAAPARQGRYPRRGQGSTGGACRATRSRCRGQVTDGKRCGCSWSLAAAPSTYDAKRSTQLRAVIVTAPDELREELRGLPVGKLLERCSRLRRT